MSLKSLLQKEVLQIRRNSFLPRLILMFPIMIMCVMPWVMNMEVKNLKVDVVDLERSQQSQRLVADIQHSRYFDFQSIKPSYEIALQKIEQNETDVVVVIPQDYSKNLTSGQDKPQVLIAANAVNGVKGAMGTAYLSQMVMMNAYPTLGALQERVSTLPLYNKNQNFKLYMIPALFAIIIMLMTGYLPTLNIVGEKEAGTMEQINVTPVKKREFILAKLIPYWGIALFIITICLLLSWGLYDIVPQGSVWLIYLLSLLLSLFFSSLGLIISNYSDTMQQSVFVMWFFVMILMLLSGLFTPTRSMPSWAYLTTYVNPLSYFIEAIRTVFIRGGSLVDITPQVLALLGISSVMSLWSVLSYQKNS